MMQQNMMPDSGYQPGVIASSRCCRLLHSSMPGLRSLPRTVPPVKSGGSAEQALSLLTRPLSKDLPARHIASIRHLCTEYSQGCTLASLPTVRKILEIVLQNVRTSNAGPFVEVACELLRSVTMPQVSGTVSQHVAE